MRITPLAHMLLQNPEQTVEQRGVLLVEQPAGGLADQADTRPHEVEGHERGHHRVEPPEAGHAHQDEAGDDADARPEIREHVLAVGDEGERAVPPAGPDEEHAEQRVDEARAEHDAKSSLELAHLDAARNGSHDLVDDEDGGEGDEPALEGGGEELDLAVAIRMVAVGRSARKQEAAEGEHRGDHVDDGLQRVGQDGRRTREPVGHVLRAQQHHRHGERDQPGPEPDPGVVGARDRRVHLRDDTSANRVAVVPSPGALIRAGRRRREGKAPCRRPR